MERMKLIDITWTTPQLMCVGRLVLSERIVHISLQICRLPMLKQSINQWMSKNGLEVAKEPDIEELSGEDMLLNLLPINTRLSDVDNWQLHEWSEIQWSFADYRHYICVHTISVLFLPTVWIDRILPDADCLFKLMELYLLLQSRLIPCYSLILNHLELDESIPDHIRTIKRGGPRARLKSIAIINDLYYKWTSERSKEDSESKALIRKLNEHIMEDLIWHMRYGHPFIQVRFSFPKVIEQVYLLSKLSFRFPVSFAIIRIYQF